MVFTEDSQIVKNYVYLIEKNEMNFEQVPNLFNLREVVGNVINN